MLIKNRFYIAFILCFLQSIAFAEEESNQVGSLLETSFRIEEKLNYHLDGSAASSEINQSSTTLNRLVYVSPTSWRVRRQRPFSGQIKEILREGDHFYNMTASNKKASVHDQVTNRIFEALVLSPLSYAQEWDLAPQKVELTKWLESLKSQTSPLKNERGDQIEFAFDKDGNVRMFLTGFVTHEGKTKVKVEGEWELKALGKPGATSLLASLLRSD